MMEHTIIRSESESAMLCERMRRYDPDFKPDFPCIPLLVVWTETEVDGYPHIEFVTFDLAELRSCVDTMERS